MVFSRMARSSGAFISYSGSEVRLAVFLCDIWRDVEVAQMSTNSQMVFVGCRCRRLAGRRQLLRFSFLTFLCLISDAAIVRPNSETLKGTVSVGSVQCE